MASLAAGLLMCRKQKGELEYFLVHPGGPFYVKKNEGIWSIPKGMPENGEEILETAIREFFEETGITSHPPFHALKSIKLKSGKVVYAWSFIGDWHPDQGIVSNTCTIEWPPSSKKLIDIPEIDRAAWMTFAIAARMIHPHQLPFLIEAKEIYHSIASSS